MVEAFRQLGHSEEILKSIKEHFFEKPSEIQEKAVPLILAGRDVIAGSATGSGKTLAFGAGMIQTIEKGKGIGALILTPTRELAEQITIALEKFSKYRELNILSVYGGVSINAQITALDHADIVVGTPGRILDHLERRTIDLSKIKTLVLDEADRMLDMGFYDDVNKIIEQCSKERQTLLFSATIDSDIEQLGKKYMNNPAEVLVESFVDASKLEQIFYDVPDNLKFSLLIHLLKQEESDLVMVFCATRRNADFVSKNLKYNKIKAFAIHGGLTQSKRNYLLNDFHKGKFNILICTDVAARGLDIKGVTHIYNYDIPKTCNDYIHRIGRTARAGSKGKAISIVASRDYENFQDIINSPDLTIKPQTLPKIERVIFNIARRFPGKFGNRRGQFGNKPRRYQDGGSNRSPKKYSRDDSRQKDNWNDNKPRQFDNKRRFGNKSRNNNRPRNFNKR